jgi:beta-N-acetylglucosaminidase
MKEQTRRELKKEGRRFIVLFMVLGTFLVYGHIKSSIEAVKEAEVEKYKNEIMLDGMAEAVIKLQDEKDKLLASPTKQIEKASRGGESSLPEILKKSEATAEQLNSYVKGTKLEGIGYSCKASEQEFQINSIILMAMSIHESGWGKNTISQTKNNVMSINANDRNPNGDAFLYASKSGCILDGARMLKKSYLTEGAKYFNGYTLEGINVKYATDKEWHIKVRARANDIKKRLGVKV